MATAPKPFVPRDVFRLLVRLEGQKTHEVDTEKLEKCFHVPSGYGNDDTEERVARHVTPGPGTYQIPEQWRNGTSDVNESAAFASKAQRQAFGQLDALSKPPSSRKDDTKKAGHPPMLDKPIPQSCLDLPPPLGSFSRANRGIVCSGKFDGEDGVQSPSGAAETEMSGALWKPKKKGVSFARARRELSGHSPMASMNALGPAQYDLKRLWDPSSDSGVATVDVPTSAVFSASKDKREVVWSSAHSLPSNAVPLAWNSSKYYAKHKRHVLQIHEQDRHLQHHQQYERTTSKPRQGLTQSTSTPALLRPTSRGHGKSKASDTTPTTTAEPLDPFEWLRRLPHGEQRANALAVKHGLVGLERPVTASVAIEDTAAHTHLAGSTFAHVEDSSSRPGTSHSLSHDDDDKTRDPNPNPDESAADDGSFSSSRIGLVAEKVTSATTHHDHDQPSHGRRDDARITVSCRLQGGLLLTIRIYSAKKVRHLKTSIVRKQTRYQNEDQFDLYLGNGKQLTQMEDSLQSLGLSDRSLLQVVSKS